jgi:hypothetical protein
LLYLASLCCAWFSLQQGLLSFSESLENCTEYSNTMYKTDHSCPTE